MKSRSRTTKKRPRFNPAYPRSGSQVKVTQSVPGSVKDHAGRVGTLIQINGDHAMVHFPELSMAVGMHAKYIQTV